MPQTDLRSNYPEPFDKPHNGKPGNDFILTPCINSFLRGSCESGHQFLKALSCGKEWCTDCGKMKSMIHERRIARWFGRVLQMNKMGYIVVTVPKELRKAFLNKKVLSEFRTYAKRKLQRMGYSRGLVRYHWAGDCTFCKGVGEGCKYCNGTGADREFKPHLNILIEEGYLPKDEFDKKFEVYKKDLGNWFNKKFKEELQGKKVVGQLFYSYAKDAAHKKHKLNYITRATFRHYDKKVCEVIKGFRTSSLWGKWEKNKIERVSKLVSLESGQCPCCGFDIKWRKDFLFRKAFSKSDVVHIEAGYFLLNINTS